MLNLVLSHPNPGVPRGGLCSPCARLPKTGLEGFQGLKWVPQSPLFLATSVSLWVRQEGLRRIREAISSFVSFGCSLGKFWEDRKG